MSLRKKSQKRRTSNGTCINVPSDDEPCAQPEATLSQSLQQFCFRILFKNGDIDQMFGSKVSKFSVASVWVSGKNSANLFFGDVGR